ncbi:MAG: HNH endonuclease [Clostridia bacterium]|nr:HNH endonuclease [Clostridia bacterium]
MKEKLCFEMVPESCWRANLRSALAPEDWDKVRKTAYAANGHRCYFCGAQGRLEAHERWSYDENNAVQKLEGVVALCSRCHEVVHIGRTYAVGRGDEAMEQFMRVNGCTQSEYHEALGKANEEYLRRNKIENWSIDLTWLKERGITPLVKIFY